MNTRISCSDNAAGPCQEKKCGRCCDPVKVPFRKGRNLTDLAVPYDAQGNPIRIPLNQIWAPESCIDTARVEIYTCLLYDKQTKSCTIYDHRPDVCRRTSCVDQKTGESFFDAITHTKFIKMRK